MWPSIGYICLFCNQFDLSSFCVHIYQWLVMIMQWLHRVIQQWLRLVTSIVTDDIIKEAEVNPCLIAMQLIIMIIVFVHSS